MEEISDKIKTLTSLRNDLLGKLAHREQKDFNKDNTSKIDEIINKKLQNFSIELEEFYQWIQRASLSAAQRNNANQSLQDFENDIKLVQDKLTNKIKRNSENIANEDNLLSSVMSLKSAAQGMNEEIKLQNSFLNKVETNFIRKTDKLKVINKRLDRLIDAASGSCLIGTILMLVVILVLIIIVL